MPGSHKQSSSFNPQCNYTKARRIRSRTVTVIRPVPISRYVASFNSSGRKFNCSVVWLIAPTMLSHEVPADKYFSERDLLLVLSIFGQAGARKLWSGALSQHSMV